MRLEIELPQEKIEEAIEILKCYCFEFCSGWDDRDAPEKCGACLCRAMVEMFKGGKH